MGEENVPELNKKYLPKKVVRAINNYFEMMENLSRMPGYDTKIPFSEFKNEIIEAVNYAASQYSGKFDLVPTKYIARTLESYAYELERACEMVEDVYEEDGVIETVMYYDDEKKDIAKELRTLSDTLERMAGKNFKAYGKF